MIALYSANIGDPVMMETTPPSMIPLTSTAIALVHRSRTGIGDNDADGVVRRCRPRR